jgi:hypothetical protein
MLLVTNDRHSKVDLPWFSSREQKSVLKAGGTNCEERGTSKDALSVRQLKFYMIVVSVRGTDGRVGRAWL